MDEGSGTLQAGIPKGIQLVSLCTCGFNLLVGYLQDTITLLHLAQGIGIA